MTPPLSKRVGAELLGTFWLVFGGCGSAIFAAKFFAQGGALEANGTELGIGFLGVALAFGLTVVTMAYAVGHVSGGHFNPAVTLGLWAAKRFDNLRDVAAYIGAQVVGGLLAGACLWGLAKSAKGSGSMVGGMAANGFAEHSPGGYSMWAVFLAEALLTAFFLFIILGVTTGHAQQHVGQPGPLDGGRLLQRQRGARAALALLGGADRRRDHRWFHLRGDHRHRRVTQGRLRRPARRCVTSPDITPHQGDRQTATFITGS